MALGLKQAENENKMEFGLLSHSSSFNRIEIEFQANLAGAISSSESYRAAFEFFLIWVDFIKEALPLW